MAASLAALLCLAACSGEGGGGESSVSGRGTGTGTGTGDTISIALEAEPPNLNPLIAADGITGRVTMPDIYQGLLCHAAPPPSPATPCLAERLAVDETGRIWAFTLRAGITWHDGAPLTAGDVAFTFSLLSGEDAAPTILAADLDDLTSVHAEGRRVVLAFRAARAGRREALARLPILPRHVFAGVRPAELALHPASRAPVGTGPLRFVSWRAGESIELARFDGAWGRPAGAARILWRIAPARDRVLRDVASGRLDLALQVPLEQAREVAASSGGAVELFTYPAPAYLAAVFNLRRPELADPRVRRALLLLLDRPAVVERILGGGAVASGPFLPGDPQADPALEPAPFDPAAARRLLAEAGRTGSARPRLTVAVPAGSRLMARVADIWASDARDHAALEVTELPYADLLARARAGRFDAALLAFTTGPDLDLYHRFHSSQVGSENYGALRDPELDRLLEAARSEPDPQRRLAHQRAIHRRLHHLVPYAFIAADQRVGLARQGLRGHQDTAAGLGAAALRRAP